MDRELLSIRNALTDTRVSIAHQFQEMTQKVDKVSFGCFLVTYCRQAAGLASWMSDWNEQIYMAVRQQGKDDLAQTFSAISQKLSVRRDALRADVATMMEWAQEYLSKDLVVGEELSLSSGMKQLRFISGECIKRKYYMSWLLIMTELERLRIVHGFTLIKLCELFFGKSVLRCFSHIHYQHQNQNELFTLCEDALEANIALHTASVQSMITEVRKAIEAYACFIGDCHQMSIQKVAHELKSAGK
jgi:hypothetical protein